MTETDQSIPGLKKVVMITLLCRIGSLGFGQCRSCDGTGTLSRCRSRWKIARNAVSQLFNFEVDHLNCFSLSKKTLSPLGGLLKGVKEVFSESSLPQLIFFEKLFLTKDLSSYYKTQFNWELTKDYKTFSLIQKKFICIFEKYI